MSIQLDSVVPFGRSLDEYRKMFNLSEEDLLKSIIGVADGPASFNAEMAKLGHVVTSIDPLYALSGHEIEQQFGQVVDGVMQQVKSTPDHWVWTYHRSPDNLRRNRENALAEFVKDYDQGKVEGRYRIGELPLLGEIKDQSYDLALCSHFLFLYSDLFDYKFHYGAIQEMLRVASEIRIIPLLTLGCKKSPYVDPIIQSLQAFGFNAGITKVAYELQRGGNEMLWASHPC